MDRNLQHRCSIMRARWIGLILVAISMASGVTVTSQEQFTRVDALPSNTTYNFDRAYLEVRGEGCPSSSSAFYSMHVDRDGKVTSVRGRLVGVTTDLRRIAFSWTDALLKQMHFRPLVYGNKTAPVDVTLTVVCKAAP